MPSRESQSQRKSVLNPTVAVPDSPVSPTFRPPLLPSLPPPMDCQNKATQNLQTWSPLSTVDQNVQVAQRAYHTYGPTDEQQRKTEALVSMGSSLITTAMACVDVPFTDEELASSNTSGTGGYRQLDELKMRFLASSLRWNLNPQFSPASGMMCEQELIQNAVVKEEQPHAGYKNKQILSIKNFMSERVIFNLTFLCRRFRTFLAVKIFS